METLNEQRWNQPDVQVLIQQYRDRRLTSKELSQELQKLLAK